MERSNENRGGNARSQYKWTPGMDSILEEGYRIGGSKRRQAINRISQLTGWPRQACWDRARKLGLGQRRSGSPRQWTPIEQQCLISLAGSRNVRVIAQRLNRSVAAIRTRLRRLSKTSARVRDGLTKQDLAELIGRCPKTIQRWIDLGWLKGHYEGKQRGDDAFRISEQNFRGFWQKHPNELPLHRWRREGLEWFLTVIGD